MIQSPKSSQNVHLSFWKVVQSGQRTGKEAQGLPHRDSRDTRGPFKGHLRLLPSVLRLGQWRDGSRFIALMALAEDLGIIF